VLLVRIRGRPGCSFSPAAGRSEPSRLDRLRSPRRWCPRRNLQPRQPLASITAATVPQWHA
jgi:hypothetical protein